MVAVSEKDYRFEKDNHFFTIFIFPFKYFWIEGKKDQPPLPSDVSREILRRALASWEEIPFSIFGDTEYNEWNYFYSYVRAMLFETTGDKIMPGGIKYLHRRDYCSANRSELEIDFLPLNGESRTIRSEIRSVDLHLFDNQIGLLSMTTEAPGYGLTDYLRYNDVVRRVYPPFLKDGSSEDAKRKSILPDEIRLLVGGYRQAGEDFRNPMEARMNGYLSNVIRTLLMPLEFNNGGAHRSPIVYDSFTDDRMFIVSYYRNESLARRLSGTRRGKFNYEDSDEWYSMIFVDGEIQSGIANDQLKAKLINSHTYERWAKWGTLYGLSRYSLIILCRDTEFTRDVLASHAKSVYYQMALMVLFQRAMLVNFSQEIKELTRYFKDSGHLNKMMRKKADLLHGDFIKFTNEYWFTEVTPQEQGIEMYRQWTKLLELDYLYAKVKGEISELASHVRTMIEHDSNQNIALITKLGLPLSIFVVAWTIWIALFGENHLQSLTLFRIRGVGFTIWDTALLSLFGAAAIFFVFPFLDFVIKWFRKRFSKPEVLAFCLKTRDTSLICPSNDGESLIILDIARRHSMDVRVSFQPWGATLDKEPPETLRDLKSNVIIVEIPGMEKERELREKYSLFALDHHRYDCLDRSNPKSSLEQFAALIGYKLNRREMGVAINDRGYIPALLQNGYTRPEIDEIRKFDLMAQGYAERDFAALERDYSQGRIFKDTFYAVETKEQHTSYLSDIHFWRNEGKEKKPDLIVLKMNTEANVKDVSFSGTPQYAKKLFEALGGFCGGDEKTSMYWGKDLEAGTTLHTLLEEIYGVLSELKSRGC